MPLMVKPHVVNAAVRIKPGRREAMRQTLALRQSTYEVALMLKEDAASVDGDPEQRAKVATALSNVVKAWDAMEDRRRIQRGNPLPGSLRPAAKASKRKPHSLTPTEDP